MSDEEKIIQDYEVQIKNLKNNIISLETINKEHKNYVDYLQKSNNDMKQFVTLLNKSFDSIISSIDNNDLIELIMVGLNSKTKLFTENMISQEKMHGYSKYL
jgi:hypothetical protein